MARFATEFPVSREMTQERFFQLVADWLCESSNSRFEQSDFAGRPFVPKQSIRWDGGSDEELSCLSVDNETLSALSVQYVKHAKNISFTVDLTLFFDKKQPDGCHWFGCQIVNSARTVGMKLPPIHKPKIINRMIDAGYGGGYGLTVKNTPHLLTADRLELAAALMNGDEDCHLPIVYVSVGEGNFTFLPEAEINRLAEELAGMAHVIVEPDLRFSAKLAGLTGRANVFGGYVGIYWAGGSGRNIIFNNSRYSGLYDKIVAVVTDSVSNRRSLAQCTRSFVQNQYALSQHRENHTINALLEEAVNETQHWEEQAQNLERELTFIRQKLNDAEDEIKRLKNDLNSSNRYGPIYDKNDTALNTVVLHCGERDLYPGEIRDMVLTVLNEAQPLHESMDRRKHVLTSLAACNRIQGEGDKLRDRIKEALREFVNLDKKTQKKLERIGFTIEQGGKHYKLTFQGDARYAMALPRSGSDRRGGNNSASDFNKKLGLK